MSTHSRYREEIDSFCAETYNVSGEEMLQMAKRSTINMTDIASGRKRFTKKALLIPIAAAVLGMTAITAGAGAAGYGPLSGMFSKYFGDTATEKLADEGYIYTAENYAADSRNESEKEDRIYAVMGDTVIKDGFTARIIGFAGDTQSPKMLVDITVEDDKVAAQSDMLGVYTLVLGEEEFEQHREDYFVEYCKAVKDETDPKLFHASVYCPPYWVTSGEEIVADIVSIHTTEDNDAGVHEYYRDEEVADHGVSGTELSDHGGLKEYNPDADMSRITGYNYYNKITEHNVEMQFRFTIPDNIFKEAAELSFDDPDMIFKVNEYPYHLSYCEFGAHETRVTLDFDAGSGTPPEKFNEDEHNLLAAKTVAEKFTLNVDGKEYAPMTDDMGVFCDTEGICNLCIKDRCYIFMCFPAVDLENAESVKLTAEGTSYELKAGAPAEQAEPGSAAE